MIGTDAPVLRHVQRADDARILCRERLLQHSGRDFRERQIKFRRREEQTVQWSIKYQNNHREAVLNNTKTVCDYGDAANDKLQGGDEADEPKKDMGLSY